MSAFAIILNVWLVIGLALSPLSYAVTLAQFQAQSARFSTAEEFFEEDRMAAALFATMTVACFPFAYWLAAYSCHGFMWRVRGPEPRP